MLRWMSGPIIVASGSHGLGTELRTCFSVSEQKPAHSVFAILQSSVLKNGILGLV